MSQLLDYLVHNEPSFRKARLPALYSDFTPQRTLNPDGYQANISAWRRALSRIALSGLAPPSAGKTVPNLLVLTCDERLVRALESKQYGRPLALGAVVAEALKEKDLVALGEFLKTRESIYYEPWTILSPWAIATWTLRQLGVVDALGRADRLPAGQFVVLGNVEDVARRFAERVGHMDTRFERTFGKAHFCKRFAGELVEGGKTLSETDMDVLLRFLSRDKGLVVYDGRTVRIRASTDEDGRELGQEDAGIAQLKELLEYLSHQTGILSARVEELAETARQAVGKKNRVAALAALKSKKIAEASLASRFATLATLEETATKLQQASDNVALVRVMDASGEALRRLNAAVGGVEGVEGAVERLRGQMETADEVNSIIADAEVAGGVVVDEGEIDDELALMEGEERRKEEEIRAKEEAEKKKVEEEKRAVEAEETRRRLEALGPVPGAEKAAREAEEEKQVEAEAAETAEELSRMNLQEQQPEPQPQLAA